MVMMIFIIATRGTYGVNRGMVNIAHLCMAHSAPHPVYGDLLVGFTEEEDIQVETRTDSTDTNRCTRLSYSSSSI